jgi:3-phenylpropionate/trans-cinnamate dioxygenase ferredoxin reductase subunit
MADKGFVIVGAGLAGAKAAETLREEGFGGRVVLVGEESERPYERPPLSKGYLLGDQDRDAVYVHGADWYEENEVELRLGQRVVALDRAAHEVELEGGERIGYRKLLLATGASPRTLAVPGADLPGVHHLRRLPDSDRLRAALSGGRRVAMAGAGWIGLEIAAAARGQGCPVTVVEPAPTPLHVALGPEMGTFFADLHRERGVEFRFGAGVAGVVGDTQVKALRTTDGEEIPADVVVVGVGARPNTALAEAAGLTVDDTNGGIVVDARLRTDDPDIHAAGDVAAVPSPHYGRRLRVEHWASAISGGQTAARAMLGRPADHDELPYFFSDQYDVGMEFTGWFAPGGYDRVVTRGDVPGRAFHAFWLAGNHVLAGMHVNLWDEGIAPVQELILGGHPVDPGRLADPAVPLSAHTVTRT